jgi:hypothetical protein
MTELAALYHAEANNQKERHRHRRPAQHMIRLLRLLLRRFPTRHFGFVDELAYGADELARFYHRRPSG